MHVQEPTSFTGRCSSLAMPAYNVQGSISFNILRAVCWSAVSRFWDLYWIVLIEMNSLNDSLSGRLCPLFPLAQCITRLRAMKTATSRLYLYPVSSSLGLDRGDGITC